MPELLKAFEERNNIKRAGQGMKNKQILFGAGKPRRNQNIYTERAYAPGRYLFGRFAGINGNDNCRRRDPCGADSKNGYAGKRN